MKVTERHHSRNQGARLTVSAPTSGTAGQTITVTVQTSDNRNNRLVTFSSNRGGTFTQTPVPTASNGVATTQFTLPNSVGAVTITAKINRLYSRYS